MPLPLKLPAPTTAPIQAPSPTRLLTHLEMEPVFTMHPPTLMEQPIGALGKPMKLTA